MAAAPIIARLAVAGLLAIIANAAFTLFETGSAAQLASAAPPGVCCLLTIF